MGLCIVLFAIYMATVVVGYNSMGMGTDMKSKSEASPSIEPFVPLKDLSTDVVSRVRFLTGHETNAFLSEDEDRYIANLSAQDLYARRVGNTGEYMETASRAGLTFSDPEMEVLRAASLQADNLLAPFYDKGIVGKKAASIPWHFAKIVPEYEEGMPHTRSDVIFLPAVIFHKTPRELVSTLIHEKIHVYQRLFGEDIGSYLTGAGYIRWKERSFYPLARSNPDLDPWVYIHPITKKPMVFQYASDAPQSMNDVDQTPTEPQFEHPYEEIAYHVASSLLQKNID